MIMTLQVYLSLLVFVGATLALPGEYVPRSYYIIDHNGHKSDVFFVRSRRDLERSLFRFKRGGGNGYSSSSAHASSSASASAGSGANSGYNPGYNPGLVFPELDQFAANFPAAFGGGGSDTGTGYGRSFAGSGSSGYSGNGRGYGNSGHAGGLGSGQNIGNTGPVLFSRFGEDEGTGVDAYGAAQGPNGAFSSVSTSSENGKVKYNVKSGKF